MSHGDSLWKAFINSKVDHVIFGSSERTYWLGAPSPQPSVSAIARAAGA